ncbi:MAG TPA: hypothetical protein VE174_07395, partial [Actinomycetota bacterium]|nr:hypothetical protein [Actinomycetota bacterium]
YDEDLDDCCLNDGDFWVLTEDSTRYAASTCTITGSNDRSVECTFDEISDSSDNEVVMAAADDCAVQDSDDNDCSTIGDAPIGESASPGFTDAPDLEDCVYNEADGTIDYIFDENLQEDSVDDTDLEAVDQDGDESASEDIDQVEDNVATASFDESVIEDAVGCNVNDESLTDTFDDGNDGNFNAPASIGRGGGSGSTTTATQTSVSTSTSTSTSTVTDSPRTINAPTSLTINYKKGRPKFKRAFHGRVGNRFGRCQSGRLVKLLKNGKNTGQATSKADGSWKVRKKGKAAKGRFQATAARKVFTRGNGDTVVCGRGESRLLTRGR